MIKRLVLSARRVLVLVLAVLFMYKALEEGWADPLWALIYVLIGIDYLAELGEKR